MTDEELYRKLQQMERETTLLLVLNVATDVGAVVFLLLVEFWT